ncbi:hypothetical protein GF354_03505 [Candidatus Peregrinibacteria bacterium]|nr:hypothetical protein [Candidatus Peregrinibacteria bacterium]
MKGFLKILVLIVVIFVLIFLMGKLFFSSIINSFITNVKEFALREQVNEEQHITELNVIFPNSFPTLEPMTLDQNTKHINLNILDSLVRPDRNLTIRPSLALTWGLIDETKWEFILRPNVKFHDGTSFESDDVLASFNRAMNYERSQLTEILSTIKKIESIDSHTLVVETVEPDPLLLQKLSLLLIIPSEYEEELVESPIGTGPYMFDNKNEDGEIILKSSADYWGEAPHFEKIICIPKPDVRERLDLVLGGMADFLAFVPQEAVDVVVRAGMDIKTVPSLEVQFLLFNFKSDIFVDRKARKALFLGLNRDELANSLGEYVNRANQFVSNGVFGFNSNIDEFSPDYGAARDLVLSSALEDTKVQISLPLGSEFLGDYLKSQLSNIGILSSISYLTAEELLQDIFDGDADIFFLGFKSELGDSSDFVHSVLASDGNFNLSSYSNPEVDRLLEESLVEMDTEKRLFNLQTIMEIAVEEDIVGIPLFEFDTIYGFKDGLDYRPRIDGFIYFDDIYN